MTHPRFVVTADEVTARIFRLTTCEFHGGAVSAVLVERAHYDRVPDEVDEDYANAIVDAMLREVQSTCAASVVISSTPRILFYLRVLMYRIVLAGASVCVIDRDLTNLSPPRLDEELSHAALL